jgi:Peptidase family M28
VELHGRKDLEAPVKRLLGPLASLGAASTTLEASFDRDHAPFVVVGVPAMTLWVEEGDYDARHHAATDTFENVDARRLALDTAVMAVLAWQFANSAQPLGRRLDAGEVTELLKQSGVEGTKRMVYGSSPR